MVASRISPDELKQKLSSGLLSFPLTDFDASGAFDRSGFRARLDWLTQYPTAGQFIAGGAGEFFSLSQQEFQDTLRIAVEVRQGDKLVISAAGYGTRMASDLAAVAEDTGADGILLLPPYLTETSQQGLFDHVSAICRSTRIGVILYNWANCRLTADTLARLAESCPNLVGLKDGQGDTEEFLRMRSTLGDRVVFINGMPTAEIFAQSYYGMGVGTYSSAIFNFIPEAALAFYEAVMRRDAAAIDGFMRDFLLPYSRIRSRQPGYAVSIVKAGVTIVGRSAGKVRPPLSDLTDEEFADLKTLIDGVGH